MVMTFTGSISVAEGAAVDTRSLLTAAVGCNLAWGIVDATLHLMAKFKERARSLATIRTLRGLGDRDRAHRMVIDALPPAVSAVLTPIEIETLRKRLTALADPEAPVSLRRSDFAAASAVFLLVFLSTLPLVVPFFVVPDAGFALRASNAVAIVMLFVAGWSLGRYAGRPGWRTGLGMVMVGIVLVGITVALGG
jgi:VIT1/CCC1 family predicted Fe2+/Mn2+ transporter